VGVVGGGWGRCGGSGHWADWDLADRGVVRWAGAAAIGNGGGGCDLSALALGGFDPPARTSTARTKTPGPSSNKSPLATERILMPELGRGHHLRTAVLCLIEGLMINCN
jgi:hypothetical protein